MTAAATSNESDLTAMSAASGVPTAAPHRTSLVASCWTLYALTLRQHLHGKRWMALAVLFLLPAGLATLIRWQAHPGPPNRFLEFVLSWMLIPQALLPLIALLYASGIILDEQEDQTITYLLIRPIPKWLIYLVKMAATWTTTVALVIILTALTYTAVYFRSDNTLAEVLPRASKAASIHSLAVIAYASLFGLLGLLTKRSLVAGMIYTVVIEGVLANLPLSLRMATVIYYCRVIAYRTLDFKVTWHNSRTDDVAAETWFIDLLKDPQIAEHPQLSTCILVLVVATIICTALAAFLCSQREFHVKTPEKD